jgi:type IV pilus assembly protein PilW
MKKRLFSSLHYHHQRGMNLVELMIAMVLGLVVVGGAGKIFLSNTQAFRLQDEVSGLQQSGQLVMEMMLADIRRAGLDLPSTASGISGKANSAVVGGALPGLLLSSDTIQVSYVVQEAMTDCEGNAAVVGATVVNQYYIDQDISPKIAALFCKGSVINKPDGSANVIGAGTALMRGVEGFKVMYGFAPAGATGNGVVAPERYANSPIAGRLISLVQLGLLVRTEAGIQGVQAPQSDINIFGISTEGWQQVSAATLQGVTVSGQFPVHRVFTGAISVRNPSRFLALP